MKEKQTKLICRRKGYTADFEITKTHLIDKFSKGSQKREKRIELSKLSSDLSYTTGRSSNVVAQLIGSGIYLAVASIFFISIIQNKIPLLSLFFCLISFWLLILSIRGMRIYTWTIIHRENGKRFSWLIHGDYEENERKAFEQTLSEIITKNNQQKDPCNQLSAPLQADT